LSWYYCTLTSRGIEPNNKTYYVSSPDSAWTTTLEFEEFAENLKSRLQEKGYIETSPDTAELCVLLDYQIGQAYLAGMSSYSTTSTYANTNVKGNTSSSGTANITAYAQGDGIKASTVGSKNSNSNYKALSYGNAATFTSTQNTYKQPLYVSISAIENVSKKPIWEVIVNDEIYRESQVSSVMPWLFLSAQPYFGVSSNGEVTTRINNTKQIKEQYNSVWPY
jgi:hypothetical protein